MQPQDITIPAPIVRAIAFDEGRSTSGLRLLVVPDSSLPWITLRLTFRHGGARSDGPLPGRADFTAGMLSAGTEQRDAITFARSIEQLGADLGADAGSDTMALELATLSEHLDEAFDLFTTMLRHPTFTDEEVDRERAQRRASLLASAAEPDHLAERLLTQEVMRGTPYATPIEGDDASLAAMSRAAIVAHRCCLLGRVICRPVLA